MNQMIGAQSGEAVRCSAWLGVSWWWNIIKCLLVSGSQQVNEVRNVIAPHYHNRILVRVIHLLDANKPGLSDINLNFVWAALNRAVTHKNLV